MNYEEGFFSYDYYQERSWPWPSACGNVYPCWRPPIGWIPRPRYYLRKYQKPPVFRRNLIEPANISPEPAEVWDHQRCVHERINTLFKTRTSEFCSCCKCKIATDRIKNATKPGRNHTKNLKRSIRAHHTKLSFKLIDSGMTPSLAKKFVKTIYKPRDKKRVLQGKKRYLEAKAAEEKEQKEGKDDENVLKQMTASMNSLEIGGETKELSKAVLTKQEKARNRNKIRRQRKHALKKEAAEKIVKEVDEEMYELLNLNQNRREKIAKEFGI